MRDLHFDYETFSPVDLTKCGAYRYAEEAEIILLAYAFDDGPVKQVDLLSGESIPFEFEDALQDPNVIKWGQNVAFERIITKACLGIEIPIEQVRCTAVWAAHLGLPSSLGELSEVLKLGDKAKLKTGKALIRKFCCPIKPTKKNGQRTRNLPEHLPVDWEEFKFYNRQDVEAERELHRRFSPYPMPDSEWELYAYDQEINDAGIRIDLGLVRNAIGLANQIRENLFARAQEITGLSNPNSRKQLMEWLDSEDVFTTDLTKKTVEQILGSGTTNEKVTELLQLRQQMAKASVSKYEAMARAVCRDGRLRGMFKFNGAGRTSRWCLTGDHEVLTPEGWQRLDSWEGGHIAVWSEGAQVSFQKSAKVEFEVPQGEPLIQISSARCEQISTLEHRMPTLAWTSGELTPKTVAELQGKRFNIPFTGNMQRTSTLSDDELRILIMVQADGHFTVEGHLRLALKKERKIARAKSLLRRAGLLHSVKEYSDRTTITVKRRHQPLWLRMFRDKTFGPWLLQESPEVIFDELEHWDGCRCGPQSVQYSTNNKVNADLIQALAHTSGRSATIIVRPGKHREDHWSTSYAVNIWLTPGELHEVRPSKVSRLLTDNASKVYCATTPTGYFMVRRNGRVWVTGNSGQIVQMQNLPSKGLIKDIEFARNLLLTDPQMLLFMYDDIPLVLSSLIRTAFLPDEGELLAVADFSAIEARKLAWFAHEQWRLELFARGGLLYETSAAKMFNVPVDSIAYVTEEDGKPKKKKGPNYKMRQKGKVGELACFAADTKVLTSSGVKAIVAVKKQDLLWDGEEWVNHDGLVSQGIQKTVSLDGVEMTPNQLIFLNGSWKEASQLASEPNMLCRALETGLESSPFWSVQQEEKALERLYGVVAVESHIGSRLTTYEPGDQRDAASAQKLKRQLQESSSTPNMQTLSQTLSTDGDSLIGLKQPSPGATAQTTRGTGTTEEEALKCVSSGVMTPERSCSMSSSSLAGTSQNSKWTELTSTEDTSQGTFGSSPAGKTCSISEKSKTSKQESLSLKSVYDIAHAGPRNRFTIITNSGALIVHNCGYQGWEGALINMGALEMGLLIEELAPIAMAWREANLAVVAYWSACEDAAFKAVKTKSRVPVLTKYQQTPLVHYESDGKFLMCELPSGRKLYYVKPRIERNDRGVMAVSIEGMSSKGKAKKWQRTFLYGGLLCIAKDTPVLTKRGWVPIQNVTPFDSVWDGEEWVATEGAVYKGESPVIKAHGAYMTADHEVLTTEGWINASQSERFDRAPCRAPDGFSVPRIQWQEVDMESSVRLRHGEGDVRDRAFKARQEERRESLVRVPEVNLPSAEQEDARDVPAPGLCGVEKHDRPMCATNPSGLEKLRRARNSSVRALAKIVRVFLGGHGANVQAWAIAGSNQQRQRLQPGQLSLDHLQRAGGQQAKHETVLRQNSVGALPSDRAEALHLRVSSCSPVYDLLSCGPRNRFVIATEQGPLIVHNCENICQASARDSLAGALIKFRDRGLRKVRLHVHDEAGVSVPREKAKESLALMEEIMAEQLPWAARGGLQTTPGLLLKGDGFITEYYRKDED